GSTAYSLSAGGPVLSPKVPAFVVTPICPHSLHSKAIVLPNEEAVEIEASSAGKCVVVVDGRNVLTADNSVKVRVSGSKEGVSFVRIDRRSFYSIMLSKFAKGK
ncbi:MAG TPA: NAD(+) kinase, partial [Clostridiales bacterium]|nr:NAD(+) kinase [Clostridiales bacterium]